MERKFKSQLGKQIPDIGAHIPHVAVGILRKKRKKNEGFLYQDGGSKVKPMKEYDPYPNENKTSR